MTSREGTILAMEDYLAAFHLTIVDYCVAFGFKNTCMDGVSMFRLPKDVNSREKPGLNK